MDRSVTFIILLELDCEETEAILETEEGNTEAKEGENIKELNQSAVPSDEENGEENGSANQQPSLDESSHTPTIQGDSLQHSDTPPELTQTVSPELTSIAEAPAESSDQESLNSDAATRPSRQAAQR